MKYFAYVGGALAALFFFFASPASAQRAWDYYDACPQKPFVKMVECGKKARVEGCKGLFSQCGSLGNSVVQYADNLAAAVRKGEMSASTAERRWIEFKLKMEAIAQGASSGPSGPSWTPPAPAAPPPRLCNYGGPGPSICY